MKDIQKRFGALALATALTLSLIPTSLIPAAWAAEETADQPEPAPQATASGKPTLHIDFLGDVDGPGYTAGDVLPEPMSHDMSLYGHTTPAADAYWDQYGSAADVGTGKVFWVGVGVDNIDAFELAQKGGLYSAEIAFYYNTQFVEPVLDDGSGNYDGQNAIFDYKDFLFDSYNIDAGLDPHTEWPEGYAITAAGTGLDPVGDPRTEEFAPDPNWKMLYASVENEYMAMGEAGAANRFDTLPTDGDTYYLMMIPFRVKAYDTFTRVCFRLARNASMFSIGSGEKGESLTTKANDPQGGFGAWERETINQGHNLKEMFDFEGDLNIFTGLHEKDAYYAKLEIDSGGNAGNGAELSVTHSPVPVMVNTHNAQINDLEAGTGMTVKLTGTASTYTSAVSVESASGALIPLTLDPGDPSGKTYTFIMPNDNVTVKVTYTSQGDGADFKAILHVVDGGDGSTPIPANTAELEGTQIPPSPGTPVVSHVGPETSIIVTKDTTAQVFIPPTPGNSTSYNTDYDITVTAQTTSGGNVPVNTVTPNAVYDFTMPAGDVEVTVTYTKAPTYRVQLSIDADPTGDDDNIAELYYYAGDGVTINSVTATGMQGGEPQMEGARDGRRIDGIVKLHQIPNPNPGPGQPATVPDYQIKRVTLLHNDGTTAPEELGWWPVTAAETTADNHMTGWELYIGRKDASGNYVGPVTMPAHDITIKVVFEKIAEYNVQLALNGDDGLAGNTATLSGTDNMSGANLTTNLPTVDNFNIYSGSPLQLTLHTAPGYRVAKVEARNTLNGMLESPVGGSIASGILNYRMPANNLKITVFYEREDTNKYEATFQLLPGDPSPVVNTAFWIKENSVAITPTYPTVENYSGTALEGEITVQPGWHISTVEVISKTGMASYPFEISGNGYNNGAGGVVTLTMNQPADDVFVKVRFVQNVPPAQPKRMLDLVVQDEDNQPGNKAQLWVNGTNLSGDVTASGGYGIYSTDTANMGDTVHIPISCAAGYYVSGVTVTPESAGVVPTWVTPTGVDFVMPAGNVTVTVTYEAIDPAVPPTHKVTLHMDPATPPAGGSARIEDLNPNITQPNQTSVDGGTITAYAWDTVNVTVTTPAGKTALVWATQPGGALALVPTGGKVVAGTTGNYTFVAPADDADVYVKFVDDDPDLGEFVAGLTVIDDDAQPGDAAGAAGSATLTRSGSGSGSVTVQSAALPGNTDAITANAGDSMTLTVAPQSGYTVSVAYVTPSGAATLLWSGSTQASFIMPNEDVNVVVRFHQGDAPKHTVDLHVSGPAGAGSASLGTSPTGGIYSQQHSTGDDVDFAIIANPGYYIQSVTVTPVKLGIVPNLPGTFGTQLGGFVMPGDNVYVNVVFAQGYPDTAEYDATLKVVDPNGNQGGTALLKNTDPARTASTSLLSGGQQQSVRARTGDVMEVTVNANTGYVPTITITDNAGNPVGYQWIDATHIRFDMAGGPTLVEVRFDKGDRKDYNVTLHVDGLAGDNATIQVTPGGTPSTTVTAPGAPSSIQAPVGSTIQVTANATASPAGFVESVIVMKGSQMISITPVANYDLGSYTGTFTVPEGDVDVYVRTGDTAGPINPAFPAVITAVAPDGSAVGHAGKAWIAPMVGGAVDTPNQSSDALSNGASQQIQATAGGRLRVHGIPDNGYVVSAIRLTPLGSGLSATVPFTWIDGETVEFDMPSQPIAVEVELKESDEIPDDLTAQVVVDGAGSVNNQGIIYETTSGAVAGQTLIHTSAGTGISVDITVAPGYEIEYVQLRSNIFGVNILNLTAAPNQSQTISFAMLPDDVVVYVKMKVSESDTFTATLKVVDTSSTFVNTARMTSGATTVTGHGQQITGLADGASVLTTVLPGVTPWPNTTVRLVAVLATDKNGTTTLQPMGGSPNGYSYTINKDDVTITVIYSDSGTNEPDDEKTYIAKVVKDDPTGNNGNTASIQNTTNTALPHADTWTEAWPDHAIRVDATAASGYYAVVTATRDDTGASVPVAQFGYAGQVTAYLDMPGVPSSDVTVKVEYIQGTPPTDAYEVKIDLADASGVTGNSATLTEAGAANSATDTSIVLGDGVALGSHVTAGNTLNVTAQVNSGAHVASAVITANGVTVAIPMVSGAGSVVMPNASAEVTVYVEGLDQSARPYDPAQDPNTKGYIPGYLKGQNLGGGRAHIKVPYLYDGVATHDAPNTVDYQLYVKTGAGYVRLIPGTDYEVTAGYDQYQGVAMAPSTGIGTEFTIRAMKGNSTLSDWLVNGRVIYITATEPGKAESDFVEVELEADPGRGDHKATLRIVDFSSKSGNGASMSEGYRVVNVDGGMLDHLVGNELIKTTVTVGQGATLVNVTVTDSTGTRALSPDSTGRYPYDMTGEDVIITVYFDDEGTPDDPELYIATVQKAGLSGVTGNEADIHNDTRSDLPKGTIWAAGYAGNDMSVDVDTAAGYYAVVTAYPRSNPGIALPVVQLGAGSATAAASFQAFVSIPNGSQVGGVTVHPDDVEVVVTFTKDPPPNYESQLTLTTAGTDALAGNTATLQPSGMGVVTSAGDGTWLVPDGTVPPTPPATLVTTGTQLNLTTTCDTTGATYYVDSVVVTISGTPTATMTITLDSNGAANFTMPLGATDVKVTWKHDPHTPRPYDPAHATAPFPAPATQDGWILAQHKLDGSGNTTDDTLIITVPTLRTAAGTYSNAINQTNPDDITYKLYTRDTYGVYHELLGADISRTPVTVVPGTYQGATFEVKSLLQASTLHYYIKHGGVIYITATDSGAVTGTAKSESDYTEVVIPANYTATLHVSQGTVAGNIAKLTESAGGRNVTAPPTSKLTGLGGSETLTTTIDTQAAGSHLVSVIVTTASGGSIHLTDAANNYPYTMAQEDVDVYVVFQDDNDPLGDMFTATVYRENDDGKAGNTASIVNEDVPAPPIPTGSIWTGAYETNVVRVDVTTEPGYYATVTAYKAGTQGTANPVPVPVVQWATQGTAADPAETHFYMPDYDVDVIVTYSTTPPLPHELKLTLSNPAGQTGNTATLDAPNAGNSVTVHGSDTPLSATTPSHVSAGTAITVTAGTAAGYAIDKVEMVVTTTAGSVTVDVPLTNGVSLPLLSMPLGDAEVIVTYKPGHQTPRPYDPRHAHTYTAAYNHNTSDDLSQTHQDGWILAQATGSDSLRIIVPTLHDMSGTGGTDQLHHAGYANQADQPTYTLYWRDSLGFHAFVLGTDIDITGGQYIQTPGSGTYGAYNAYQFDVKVKSATALWGGYHLAQYLRQGGSIYITATGTGTTPTDVESEKTEVVVPKNDRYTATLHIVDTSGLTGNGITMSEVGGSQSPVTTHLGQLTDLVSGTTVRTAIAPLNTGAQVAGVVATVNGSSVNLTDPTNSNIYDYVMGSADVDIYVVLQSKNDPLGDMYIATVYKDDPDNKPGNKAEVIVNEDVPTPPIPVGPVWTGAYKDNVIRVEVETEPGYYAVITAKTAPGGADVPVVQWAVQGTNGDPIKAQFYMPASDVDVTVKFTTQRPDPGTLELTLAGDTDNNAGNSATLSTTGTSSITLNGTDSPLTAPISSGTVAAGTTLNLTTTADTANNYAVRDAKMRITLPAGSGTPTGTVTVDIPLTDGAALPSFTMPLGNAEVIVTYESGVKQTPRPFDPMHDNYYTANYPGTVNPDKSQTHQDGWILATPTGKDSFRLVVPTLHDMSNTGGTDKLHYAGYTNPAQQPAYKLYWRDTLGVFHELTVGTDIEIDVTNGGVVSQAYTDTTHGTGSYDGYAFDVKVKSATALWGGYHLDQYLKNGGSIYITATGPNTTGTPADRESEKTEVVIPQTYTATLHITDVSGVPGSVVTMSEALSGQSVTQDGDTIVALAGNETINTAIAPVSSAVRVVGVVATTDSGSVNLTDSGGHSYDYVMQQSNVDIYVVIQSASDPLDDMYIATLYKVDPAQNPQNKAEIIVNEDVSTVPHGPIWTAAYEDNVIRVDVTADNGYYAEVTAVRKDNGQPVKVVQWGTTGSFSSQFYMPTGTDVDVTVTFSTTPLASRDLYLTLEQPTGVALADNQATLTANVATLTLHGSDATVSQVPMASNPIPAGQALKLSVQAAPNYMVEKAVMKVYLGGIASGVVDFTVDIPLTDGASLPDFAMPLGDAEVVVTYKVGHQTPRPYDPDHAHVYNNSYNHNTAADLSATHQDGWLLAAPTGSNSFTLLVPTLHDLSGSPAADTLYNAGDAVTTNPQPTYRFYWRDSVGAFHEITGPAITVVGTPVNNSTGGQYGTFVGYQLDVTIDDIYDKWGGYHLAQYIAQGGSIYVTATGVNTAAPDMESEKTEVVFPRRSYTATLYISDVSTLTGNGVTMSEVGGTQTPVTTDLGQLIDLTAGTTVKTAIAPLNAGAQVAGVVATVNGSSVNLTDAGGNVYNYVMGNADVDIYVVIQSKKDPLGDMYIATAYKDDPDNKPGNIVRTIVNENVSNVPHDVMWTGAYKDNSVRVEVQTESGYYAIVTAKTVPGGVSVPVIQWATQGTNVNPAKAQFYMPASDVDVTVKFTTQKPDAGTLELTLDGDTDNNAANTATATVTNPQFTYPSQPTVTVNGTDSPLTKSAGQVEPSESIDLTTAADTANDYGVKQVELKVTLPGNTTGTPDFILGVPITDGEALPPITMPLGDVEIVVTYESGVKQTPRPYDPLHSDAFNAAPTGDYKTSANPDRSQTHQEGWLLAVPTGTNSFTLLVPTLHDMDATQNPAVDQLHPAGYDPSGGNAASQPSYQLYWRDPVGAFHAFTTADITVAGQYVAAGDPGTYGAYDAYQLDVTVNPDATNVNDPTCPTLWGGYTLQEYLKNGGSIYITATGPNTTAAPIDMESEKTEVVIPGVDKYKATLVYTPNGTAATMTAWGKTTSTDGDIITGSNGTEVVKVDQITAATGYHLVGVVATTASGSVNATPNGDNTEFTYTMDGQDVEMRVVFDKDDNPLEPKGPHIVTVYKEDDDGLAQNTAAVKDLDVDIPGYQKGTIWTAAYEDNVVQVDVTTANGYYAEITAVQAGTTTPVDVVLFANGANGCYGQFYMPAGCDVDVTVKYIPGARPQRQLALEVLNAADYASNSATVSVAGSTLLTADGTAPTPAPVSVAPGTALTLVTGHEPGYSVKSAVLRVQVSPTSTVDIAVPLTDGTSLPIPAMPMADAKLLVEFEHNSQMPRPYDPIHSEAFNTAYHHGVTTGTNPDLSQTSQEGWILAGEVNADDNTFSIIVPTLHDMAGTPPVDSLYHAGYDPDGPNAAQQPKYNLYWKDSLGNFQPFNTADIAVTAQYVPVGGAGAYGTYGGYKLDVEVKADPTNPNDQTYPTLWGGYTLREYIQNGGSIYISAVAPDGSTDAESEKTEVVIPAGKRYTATLHFVTTEGSAVMNAWGGSVNTDGSSLTGTNGTERVTVKMTPNSGYVKVGVVATTASGSVNATWNAAQNQFEYDMVNQDVDIYVVFDAADDPLQRKGPHIVTVLKKNDDGYTDNDATVRDLDVDIPANQKGDIWTAAYEGNVVQVDVTTHTGYYPVITAVKKNGGASIDVAVFMPGPGQYYGKFYMPAGTDVDVTVEYVAGTMPIYQLQLRVVDNDGLAVNTAIVSMPHGVSLNANGQGPNLAGPVNAAPGTALTLTTGHGPNHSVQSAVMKVGTTTIVIDVPLTDGVSLPIPAMPMDDAEIVVTFQQLRQMPRPYDPLHSTQYNGAPGGNYPSSANPDESETGQEGWILAGNIDKDERSFYITVPTLHDKAGAFGADVLYNTVEDYNLYWKDNLGNFQLLTAADITVSDGQAVSAAYNDGTQDYTGYTFKVTVNPDTSNPADNTYPTLWGGYTVWDYIQNGGSLYISALDDGGVKAESEKTEVVIPGKTKFTATLFYTPNGTSATMTAWGKNTSTDADSITGANGTETVKVNAIQPDSGYELVGVVATTVDGSVNAIPDAAGTEYSYTMQGKDVEMQVVFRASDDPLQDKGPHIVTVYKVDTDGHADNNATVKDLDVTIPSSQRGDIWTAAYEGNTVEVDVTTHAGYYAVVTAKRVDTGAAVDVITYPDKGLVMFPDRALLEMVDADVDVTVTYVKAADLPKYDLKLTVSDPNAQAGNTADVVLFGASTALLSANGATPTTDGPQQVTAGTSMTLETGHASGHSVVSAVMRVDTANGTKDIDIPLTDGTSLPLPVMPMANAEIIVTFDQVAQTPRPFDPAHDHDYTAAYNHNTADDLSRTHQDGWILAATENPNSRTVTITVPTLHDMGGTGTPADKLYDAVKDASHTYKLYWKDGMGNFQELVDGTDVDFDWTNATVVTGSYQDFENGGAAAPYNGVKFNVTIRADAGNTHAANYPTLWGGYTLWQYIQNGGSLYISAIDQATPAGESEKTEVVIRSQMPRPFDPDHSEDYSATYDHSTDDLSQSHDEGWIKGKELSETDNSFKLTVPTLYGKWGTVPPGTLYDAVEDYKFYYKAADGSFTELVVDTDITLDNPAVETDYYTDTLHGSAQYDGYSFTVKVVMTNPTDGSDPAPATTGGEELAKYIAEGGSIYITAIDSTGAKDESDKTEVVLAKDDGLRPYDPDNENDPNATPAPETPYEDHWITSENRGDHLIVTVPILAQDDGSDKTDVDKTKHTFQFYLKDEARAADTTNYPGYQPEELAPILELSHPDPDNDPSYNDQTDPPYENESYYSESDGGVPPTVTNYKGARFVVKVKSDADIETWVDDWAQAETDAGNAPTAAEIQTRKDRLKELAAMVRKLMDNEGTTEAIENGVDWTDDNVDNKGKYRLYITHTDSSENPEYVSKLVDFEIPRYYSFKGILESYAPKHAATFTLYALGEESAANPGTPADPLTEADYETKPFLVYDLTQDFGTGLWQQDFSVKSSHLMKRDKSGQVYKLVVSKPGHVTYTWLGLELTPVTLDQSNDPDCLTFTLDPDVNDGMIALIGGDFDGNGANGLEDLEIMTNLMAGEILYNRQTDDTQADWVDSIYNPETLAYAADLDGNGRLGSSDLKILNDYRNFRQRAECYQAVMPQLINGSLGNVTGGGVVQALFMVQPLPQWADELLQDGKEVPDWAMELILDGKELPQWAVDLIVETAYDGLTIPDWAIDMAVEAAAHSGPAIPDWAVACIKAGTEVPAWATALISTGESLPTWAAECIAADTPIPDWAVDMIAGAAAHDGPAIPDWAIACIEAGKAIPAWASELAQNGEELPEDMAALLAAGEDLPQELPAAPEVPEAPAEPELPADPNAPAEGVDTPEDPDKVTDPDVSAGEEDKENAGSAADAPAQEPADPDVSTGDGDDLPGEGDIPSAGDNGTPDGDGKEPDASAGEEDKENAGDSDPDVPVQEPTDPSAGDKGDPAGEGDTPAENGEDNAAPTVPNTEETAVDTKHEPIDITENTDVVQ